MSVALLDRAYTQKHKMMHIWQCLVRKIKIQKTTFAYRMFYRQKLPFHYFQEKQNLPKEIIELIYNLNIFTDYKILPHFCL
uniref:Uncharacterized protein n=1 Tax=Rhipicephalus appendiculatus TaxID=34631 RepID=A0A131YCP1_RHIAP